MSHKEICILYFNFKAASTNLEKYIFLSIFCFLEKV